jgi:hypothetical protein
MSEEKRLPGRPSSYTPDLAEQICALLAEGEPLRAICDRPDMPGQSTVYRWIEEREDFRERYTRARVVQGSVVAERGYMEALEAGKTLDPAAARVRFDAARWLAGKLAPKVYGEKTTTEHTGPGGGPVRMTWGDGTA